VKTLCLNSHLLRKSRKCFSKDITMLNYQIRNLWCHQRFAIILKMQWRRTKHSKDSPEFDFKDCLCAWIMTSYLASALFLTFNFHAAHFCKYQIISIKYYKYINNKMSPTIELSIRNKVYKTRVQWCTCTACTQICCSRNVVSFVPHTKERERERERERFVKSQIWSSGTSQHLDLLYSVKL
jgi:hypothetical protein